MIPLKKNPTVFAMQLCAAGLLSTLLLAGPASGQSFVAPDPKLQAAISEAYSKSTTVQDSPGVSAITGDSVPMKLGANLKYMKTSESLCSPVINVPAPFGVAQSLGEMADSAKTNALTSMKSQFTSLLSPTMGNLLSNIAVVKATLP